MRDRFSRRDFRCFNQNDQQEVQLPGFVLIRSYVERLSCRRSVLIATRSYGPKASISLGECSFLVVIFLCQVDGQKEDTENRKEASTSSVMRCLTRRRKGQHHHNDFSVCIEVFSLVSMQSGDRSSTERVAF